MFGLEGPVSAEQLSAEVAEAACRQLMASYDIRTLVLTCGATGSYVFSDGLSSYLATPKVTVGDSFTAAFIASLLQGKSLRQAHQAAVRVSAYVCTCKGAMPILPQEMKDE